MTLCVISFLVLDGVTPDELHVLEGTNLVHYTACWKALRGTGLTVLPTNICALDKDQGFCFVSTDIEDI